MLYSPTLSRKDGILACVEKEAKRRKVDSFSNTAFQDESMIFYPAEIMDAKQKEWELKNPDAAKRDPERTAFIKPQYYEQELEKMRQSKSEIKTRQKEKVTKPEQPLQGPYGKAGKFASGGTYAQYVMKNTIKNTMRDQDPREALLARAKEAEENPLFVQTAYQQTQPKTIFNY